MQLCLLKIITSLTQPKLLHRYEIQSCYEYCYNVTVRQLKREFCIIFSEKKYELLEYLDFLQMQTDEVIDAFSKSIDAHMASLYEERINEDLITDVSLVLPEVWNPDLVIYFELFFFSCRC